MEGQVSTFPGGGPLMVNVGMTRQCNGSYVQPPVLIGTDSISMSTIAELLRHDIEIGGEPLPSLNLETALKAIACYFGSIPVTQWKSFFEYPLVNYVKTGFASMKSYYIDKYRGTTRTGIKVDFEVKQCMTSLFQSATTFQAMQLFIHKLYDAKMGVVSIEQKVTDLGNILSNYGDNHLMQDNAKYKNSIIEIPNSLVEYFSGICLMQSE